jgi:hypothetical protein
VVVSEWTTAGENRLTGSSSGLPGGISALGANGLDHAETGALASAGSGPGAMGGNESSSMPEGAMSKEGSWVSISPTLAGMYGRGLTRRTVWWGVTRSSSELELDEGSAEGVSFSAGR